MTTPDYAIEAGAEALWAHVMADDPLAEPWHEADSDPQRETREAATVVYAAMEPLTRQAVVEQFRTALLAGLDDLERDGIRRLVSPGDVADLIARVHHQIGEPK